MTHLEPYLIGASCMLALILAMCVALLGAREKE
jgi:hypothetical protein